MFSLLAFDVSSDDFNHVYSHLLHFKNYIKKDFIVHMGL